MRVVPPSTDMYLNTKIERKQNIIAVALLRFSPLPGITTNVLICEAHMNKSNLIDNRPSYEVSEYMTHSNRVLVFALNIFACRSLASYVLMGDEFQNFPVHIKNVLTSGL